MGEAGWCEGNGLSPPVRWQQKPILTMKRLYSLLLLVTAWIAGGHPGFAVSYPVTLAPGLQIFANHLGATLDLGSALVPPGPMTVLRYNNASGSFMSSTYDPDMGGWTDPSLLLIAPGEAAFIDNATFGPVSFTPTGAAGTIVPSSVSSGRFALGRQTVGLGTFESILGRSPQDYSSVVVYR